MKHHTIAGGGGGRLHLVEAGNPEGQAILFIHGLSQCSLSWSRQLGSDLARSYRLVAMDMRGHGSSDRPREGYDDSRLWAEDVDSAMRALDLDRPVLCGWSYGPLVMLDYIRHHGEERIGGIHLVGAVTKLGSEAASSVLTPEFLGLVPGLLSSDVDDSVRSLEGLLRLCFARGPAPADLCTMLGYSVSVPPFVRRALLSRVLDNDDILPTVRKPVLITHGAQDAIVRTEVVEQHRSALAHAQVHVMPGAGHAPFWDAAASFNRRLAAFCDEVARRREPDAAGRRARPRPVQPVASPAGDMGGAS
jgi:pimeloyl-ACP methyl ester carboxylesterase